ncbi:MAG: hypothetical protein HYZ89_00300 [Candidatus Omnitrophica bacterium]|nr:hypothetical protein [Candidatus Omnitrophota bacterium]
MVAQATLEYAVVIAVIVAALLAMQIYMKRGVQGKLRDATDQVGEQYRPANTTSSYTVHSQSTRQDTVDQDGKSRSQLTADEVQNKFGSETVDTSGETKLF